MRNDFLMRNAILAVTLSMFTLTGCGSDAGAGDSAIRYFAEGCPEYLSSNGAPCDTAATCQYELPTGDCSTPVRALAICADQEWSVYTPLECSPSDVLACDPVGTWHIAITEPYVDPSDPTNHSTTFDHYTSYELTVIQDSTGLLRAALDTPGTLSDDGCTLSVSYQFDEPCYGDLNDETVCPSVTAQIDLDLSKSPVMGTVNITHTGDWDEEGTAPVQATKQP